jgi:hypothetical protein
MHAYRHLTSDNFREIQIQILWLMVLQGGKKFFDFTPFITLLNGSMAITIKFLQRYSV